MAVERQRTRLGMSQPIASEIKVETSGSGSFAQGLLDAASSAFSIGSDYAANMVENDKVVQANRALRGLMPSEDATGGGTRAHMLVSAQNTINEMSSNLKEDSKNWNGTDEEWDKHVIQNRVTFEQSLYEQYPELKGDPATSKLVTNMMLEQAPSVQMTKIASDLEREHIGRQQTFTTRLTQATANLDGSELSNKVNGELRETSKALQMSDVEYEVAIANEAKARAATGDTRLLGATQGVYNSEGVSLYDRDASLRAAYVQGRRVAAGMDATGLANDQYSLEQSFLSGDLDDSQFLQAASIMNDRTGGAAYSAGAINSLRAKKAKQQAAAGKGAGLITNLANGNLVALEDYTEKEINDGQKAYHAQVNSVVDAYSQSKGLSDTDREGLRARAQSEATVNLAKAGIKDSILVRQINSFMNIGPDHLASMTKEPEEMQTLLNRWNTLPDSMRNQIVGENEAAFIYNYQVGLSNNMNPGQALDFAQKAGRNINFSAKDNKDISEKGASVAGDLISKNGLNPFDNFPDYIRQQMISAATDDVRRFRKAGYDMDGAKQQASLNLTNNYSYEGGTVIKGDKRKLAQQLKINEQDMGVQFQSYLQVNKQKLEDSAGGPGIDQMYFDIDQRRGVFTVRAGSNGIPVQTTKPLSELGDYKWLDQVTKEDEASKKEMKDRIIKAQGYGFSGPTLDNNLTNSLMNTLFPPSEADANIPRSPEFGELQKNATFEEYLKVSENQTGAGYQPTIGVFIPYDSDMGTAGMDTIGFGHKLTPEEKKNGFIEIGGKPVPFLNGESQMTRELADALLKQDIQTHTPATPGWDTSFDELPGSIKRGLVDTSFNMGKNFLSKNPTANAWFKQGDYNSGFIQLLTASNENGKRSKGVLVRRASAYNLANPGEWPKIDKVDVKENGEMSVRFKGDLDAVNPKMRSLIGDGGWMLVKRGSAGSMHEQSKAGEVDI